MYDIIENFVKKMWFVCTSIGQFKRKCSITTLFIHLYIEKCVCYDEDLESVYQKWNKFDLGSFLKILPQRASLVINLYMYYLRKCVKVLLLLLLLFWGVFFSVVWLLVWFVLFWTTLYHKQSKLTLKHMVLQIVSFGALICATPSLPPDNLSSLCPKSKGTESGNENE